MTTSKPNVLFVYYTYSQQTRRVVDVMTGALRDRDCEVFQAKIEFTDPRYVKRFAQFPLRHAYRDLFAMLLPQMRRATGAIRVESEASDGDYDLVCIASPTWWLTTCMPVRSFMKSDLARRLLAGKRFAAIVACRRYWRNNLESVKRLGIEQGGEYVGGTHFTSAGGQITSLLSLCGYLSKGENRERYLGVRIPPAGLKPDYAAQARAFAGELAECLGCEVRT